MTPRLLLAVPLALALASPAGAAGSPTLRRSLSTRSAAMADAYAAVPGGLSSLSTNPAGLAAARRPQLDTTFTSGVLDDTFGFLGWAQPLPLGALAAGLSYYDAGKVDLHFAGGRTETRTAARDFVGHLAWGLPLPGGLSVGAAGKFFRFELAQEAKASGAAGDVGAQWRTPLQGLVLGAALQNAGPGVKFEVDRDPLPLTTRGGASWSWQSRPAPAGGDPELRGPLTATRFLAAAEAVKVRDEALIGALGSELAMDFGASTSIALRAGWRLNSDHARLTFGVGMREGRFSLDYAMAEKRSLGQTHHAGFGVRF
ncbi:MAG: PorV/PorQ family protein [Elusimicrobia bacterium]|nr:PorV/PorQ family protein [Elusimicrobiota bacterium]